MHHFMHRATSTSPYIQHTPYIAQRSWGKDKGNGTTSLIRPQSRRLFLGPSAVHPPWRLSTPDSGYRLPVAYWRFGYCFLSQSVDPYSDVPGSHVRATMLNLSLEWFEGTTTE